MYHLAQTGSLINVYLMKLSMILSDRVAWQSKARGSQAPVKERRGIYINHVGEGSEMHGGLRDARKENFSLGGLWDRTGQSGEIWGRHEGERSGKEVCGSTRNQNVGT